MMLAKVLSYGLSGLDVYPITIEVDISQGLPSTIMVGLPDNAVRESKERVRSAIRNSGYKFTPQKITINLRPADVKKEGPCFDLSIALGILAASGQIAPAGLEKYVILGELSLDGHIQPVNGILPAALRASRDGVSGLILPAQNAEEAALVNHLPIYPASSLQQTVHFLNDPDSIKPYRTDTSVFLRQMNRYDLDFSEVKGQYHIKRGLEIAAAGGHNILMIGPPGSGKTMLAKRFPTILPDMTFEESLETTRIHSVYGQRAGNRLVARRPFRAPHHTCSDVALIGGGSFPKPGEASLAHNGILFLDELPEFNRNALEALRQPLEDRFVHISRASKSIKFPSNFILVCAMNPCPCGWYTDSRRECYCTPGKIEKYLSKISGPLLDRIDIHLDVPSVNYHELTNTHPDETSAQIKERVNKARAVQLERFSSEGESASGGKDDNTFANAQMNHKQVRKYCVLGKEESELLKTAMTELNLSARAYDKILKVSRTIADWDGADNIKTNHLAEAIQYRSLDRDFFA